jgi:hypothetical protein
VYRSWCHGITAPSTWTGRKGGAKLAHIETEGGFGPGKWVVREDDHGYMVQFAFENDTLDQKGGDDILSDAKARFTYEEDADAVAHDRNQRGVTP